MAPVPGAALTSLEVPEGLPRQLVPIAWLAGRWEGVGVIDSPEAGERQVGQEVEVSVDQRGFMHYRSQLWLLDEGGQRTDPLDTEVGYWRVAQTQSSPTKPGVDVELVLAHPTGTVELFVGRGTATRIELTTDAVVSTPGGEEYRSGVRTYGQVEGDLLWVLDASTATSPLKARVSARLTRV